MRVRLGNARATRAGGAIAWKLALGIALGVAAIWIASQTSLSPAEIDTRSAGGAIAVRTPVPNTESRPAPAPIANASDPQTDPFAGVDVRNDSVLRHIAGIEDKARARPPAARSAPKSNGATGAEAVAQSVQPVSREGAEARVAPSSNAVPSAEAPKVVLPALQAAAEVAANRTVVEPTPAPEQPNAAVLTPPPASAPANSNDRVLVAALGSAAASPPTVAPLKVTNRTVPTFPGEAIRAGIQNGRVIARLTIEADGHVSGAQILSASPVGFFEKESRKALATWRYEPPGKTTSTEVELVFNRE